MLWPPTASAAVGQVAVRELPLPDSATAEHPVIDVPPSVKLTLPVGALPFTVAANVTAPPNIDGLGVPARPVVVPEITICARAALLDPALPLSPA